MKISGNISGLNAYPPRPGRAESIGPSAGEKPRAASQDAHRPGRTLPVERVLEGEVVDRVAGGGYDPFARARLGAGVREAGGHGRWQGIAAYEAQQAAAAPVRTARYVDCYV